MKKLISLALALLLAVSLTVPAFAAGSRERTVGVLLNGEQVAFPDQKPVLKNGRTMVPLRPLMEKLGGTARFEADKVYCTVGDTELTFTPGSSTVAVKKGTETSSVEMDAICYVVDGRTYVPVRFFAQALGYDVTWDSADQSASVVDRSAVIAEIDKNFTQLNAALARLKTDPTKNYQTTASYDISVKMAGLGAGVTSAALKMNLTMISSASDVEMKGTADASSLAKLMGIDAAVQDGSMTAADAAAIRTALANVSFDMILSVEKDTCYLRLPLLGAMMSGSFSAADLTKNADTWYSFSLGLKQMGFSADQLNGTADSTVGELVYAMTYSMNAGSGDLYTQALSSGTMLASLLGDASAVKSGTSCTWTLDAAKINALLGEEGISEETFKTFSVTLTAAGDGTLKCVIDVQTAPDPDLGTSMGISGEMTLTASSARLDLKLDMGSLGSAAYLLNMTMTPTAQSPATQPPAGATIVDLGSLLGIGSLTGVGGLTGIGAVPALAA